METLRAGLALLTPTVLLGEQAGAAESFHGIIRIDYSNPAVFHIDLDPLLNL